MMEERGYKRYSRVKDYVTRRYGGEVTLSDEEINQIDTLIATEELTLLLTAFNLMVKGTKRRRLEHKIGSTLTKVIPSRI